jgi:hypothetical protein
VPVTDPEPPPTDRRRAILGVILVLAAISALTAAGQVWVWLADGDPMLAGVLSSMLGAAVGGVLLTEMSAEAITPSRRLHGPDNRWWTARTGTGMRTIDLHRLRTIGRWNSGGGRLRTPSRTWLVLTDTRGARLTANGDDPTVLKIIREALVHSPQVRISPEAAKLLQVEPTMRGWLADHALVVIWVPLLLTIGVSVGTYWLIHW